MSRLLKSSGSVAAATLISRVLGMVRETVFAGFMGVGPVADAFYFALTVPNLFRRLLGEGALTAAFIPIFKEKEHSAADPREVWRATSAVVTGVALITAALSILVALTLTVAVNWIPMGSRWELVARLLRVMFPYVALACLAAVFIGVLNARGRFFLPALGTSVLNVVLIASVFLLAPLFGRRRSEQVFGLAVGVLVAGVCQAAIQLPALWREGFRLRWTPPWSDPTVRQVARRMAPATIGVAAYQLNVAVTQLMAYHQGESIVSAFNYAVRLMELPQGVIGVSLATYLLTELSGAAAAKDYATFRASLKEGLLQLLFINALATAILLALAAPMIRLLFQHGAFTASDTPEAAFALRCLAPGLIAFSLNNILARAFYALGDTRTPMRISVFCLGVNLVLATLLLPMLRQGGMGLANTVSGVVNSGLLAYALKRALPRFSFRAMAPNALRVAAAAVAAAVTATLVNAAWDRSVGFNHLPARFAGVFLPIVAASVVFFGLAWMWKLPQAQDLAALATRRQRRSPNRAEPESLSP